MAYITTSQLNARLGDALYDRLTDRDDGDTSSNSVAQQLIDEAEAEANSYLALRYVTPVNLTGFNDARDVLEARVLDLAEYNAWKSSPFTNDIPARVSGVYANALAWLRGVAFGQIKLPGGTEPARVDDDSDPPLFTSPGRPFSSAELDGL